MASSPSEEAQEVAPKRIYLQRYGNPNDNFVWTWCSHRIEDDDVSYIRDPDLKGIIADMDVTLGRLDWLLEKTEKWSQAHPEIRHQLGHVKAEVLRIRTRLFEALP